jgi:hypothetical protein
LSTFDTQTQFIEKLSDYFQLNKEKNSLLIIQIEFSKKEDMDLLACVRHLVVESFKENYSFKNHIALLINIPKENVRNFVGYQFGHWNCYHLDELEEWDDWLPSFECLNRNSLSSLLRLGLDNRTFDLNLLLKRLAHNACSLIVDTNLTRTIHRIDMFINLCEKSERFVEVIVKRLIWLQEEKESEYMKEESRSNWLVNEVAQLKQINNYSTLRRACQYYFHTKLSPLLAYLLAYSDSYSNLDVLDDSLNDETMHWKHQLWLDVFENRDICKLTYMNMRSRDESHSKELSQFLCESEWTKKTYLDDFSQSEHLKPKLPFFWLLVNQLNSLSENIIENLFYSWTRKDCEKISTFL